jgi:hypothetical protein
MSSSLDIEIRNKLASYLVDEISLEEFEDWFVPSSWNVVNSPNRIAIDLVYEIELLLAEFHNECWNEDELRGYLRPLVNDYRVEIEYDYIIVKNSIAKIDQYPLSFASFGM